MARRTVATSPRHAEALRMGADQSHTASLWTPSDRRGHDGPHRDVGRGDARGRLPRVRRPQDDPQDLPHARRPSGLASAGQGELNRGTLRAPTRTTLQEAAEAWLKAAETGVVRTRSGDRYKPSALRAYEEALRTKLLPVLGHIRLSSITSSAASRQDGHPASLDSQLCSPRKTDRWEPSARRSDP